jgi:hypothetical protein
MSGQRAGAAIPRIRGEPELGDLLDLRCELRCHDALSYLVFSNFTLGRVTFVYVYLEPEKAANYFTQTTSSCGPRSARW